MMKQPVQPFSTRPAAGPSRAYAFPTAERCVLANGLTLLIVPLRRLPVATAFLMCNAGAERDNLDEAGAAALAASALAEGTRQRDAVALSEAFEGMGSTLDAGVGWTMTEVSTTVVAARLADALHLLAEVVREPLFPEVEVTRLRDERLAELLQLRAEPRGLADDLFAHFVFSAGSRYALPDEGDEATVGRLGREIVARSHEQHVVPMNSTLIVVGDVRIDDIIGWAERAFSGWSGEAAALPGMNVASAFHSRRVHLVEKAEAPQSELRVGHASIARTHPDFHAVSVMNAILGGLFNSRINLNLREAHGYTYGAFSHFDWRGRASAFEVSSAVRTDATAASVREILGEIDRVRNELVAPTELSLAVEYLTGVFPIRFETTAAIADALAVRESFGLPANYYDTYRAKIADVSAADVLRVAQAHLQPERLQVVAVGDAAAIRPELEALKLGELAIFDAQGRPISTSH